MGHRLLDKHLSIAYPWSSSPIEYPQLRILSELSTGRPVPSNGRVAELVKSNRRSPANAAQDGLKPHCRRGGVGAQRRQAPLRQARQQRVRLQSTGRVIAKHWQGNCKAASEPDSVGTFAAGTSAAHGRQAGIHASEQVIIDPGAIVKVWALFFSSASLLCLAGNRCRGNSPGLQVPPPSSDWHAPCLAYISPSDVHHPYESTYPMLIAYVHIEYR